MTLDQVKNVYCAGRNYRMHAEELGNAVPESPMFFMKPTHSLVLMDGSSITLPGDQGEIHYEAEWIVHISKPYRPGMTVDELVDRFALGIDFTLRDVQTELKRKGHPWLRAKGFRYSAPVTRFLPFPGMKEVLDVPFSLRINGNPVQLGRLGEMIFSVQQLVDFCGEQYGLGEGDLIYTGTPAGVGPVSDGDRFELKWNGEALGSCTITLKA